MSKGIASVAFYGLTVAAVWLGWEMVKAPVADRAPPAMAVRVAPGSPEVLRRAAEGELAAGRVSNADALALESLAKAPFNARTLRVVGLAAARSGQIDQADSLLTLAGNWSLRDDPAHAWLIQQRLRQGNFDSAFAHADTLARRLVDGNDRIYELFATAALVDRRSLPALTTALARNPSWRPAFISYLIRKPNADPVLLTLGIMLAKTPNGFSNDELSWIYQSWYGENRFEAIRLLRANLGRPGRLDDVQNGDFSDSAEKALLPFTWRLDPLAGISAAIIEDDFRPNENALRVEYDGYANGAVAEQILMLPAGRRTLSGQERVDASPDTSRLRWRILCVETGETIGLQPVAPAGSKEPVWRTFRLSFSVPATGCSVQRLRLETDPGDRRATTIAWFDKLVISADVKDVV
jgi:hypothetical protein